MRYLIVVLAVLALGTLTLAGQAGSSQRINALTSAASLVVYSEDGAADASVTENPPAQVRAIVNLRSRPIPLLIAHLDDARPTSAKLNGKALPVDYVCLDILTNIISAPGILIKDCADGGLGACVDDRYYFRPDAFARKGDGFVASCEVARVKANWQRAYRRGGVKFKYPTWWKRRI
ncbi:MAG: hypothetical protein M3362_03275 [Acidobacteriota bacterium]|nr:hypothetical protein [Acidobacteriota bacterium]